MLNIIFHDDLKTKKFILGLLNKTWDSEHYIIDKQSKERVIDSDGSYITVEEFGGVKKGSQIFVKNNIVSLVTFYDKYLAK